MGATGKSAQIPLYVWLPDAMEGPTPVSALIHAATMVTAGVYMVARSHVLFALAPFSSSLVAIIGVVTALYAATIALTQVDLKRVLAYSTISQLGYMFLGAGVGAYSAAIFHLMTHAFFKALLFLAAGSAMHALHVDVLDIRKAGGLAKYARVTWFTFLVGALALAGFPGLSGFFSKDEILAKTFESGNVGLWALGLLTAGLTAFYIFRAFILTFHGEERWKQVKSQKSEVKSHDHPISKLQSPISNLHPHESPAVMTVPLVLLAILAIIGGYVGLPAVFGGSQFEAFLAPVFGEAHQAVPNAGLELALIGASVLAALFGIGFAYLFYVARQDFPARLAATYPEIYTLLVNKYYVDEIYNALFVQPLKALANFFWQFVDGRIIDGAANGAGYGIARLGQVFRRAESGYVRAYALAMVIGVVVILAVVVLR
jgi:NADH-quinone oxidoreductase subunit L